MNLREKIHDILYMKPQSVLPIIDKKNTVGYLCKNYDKFLIAIDCDYSEPLLEEFVGVKICTNYLNMNGETRKVLCMECDDTIDFDKFVSIGANFLDLKNRKKILKNPYSWIDEWKKIFGNHIKNSMIYDVVGELVSLKEILKIDKTAKWVGPADGTHDIVSQLCVYEVKTTINKTSNNIHINSAFQLSSDVDEYLYFCRLEKKPRGVSIKSLVLELMVLGYNKDELEESLSKAGIKKGSRAFKETYDILEIRSYKVTNENFPILSKEEINQLAPKKNIVNYSLELDLTPVEYERIL